MIIDLLRPTPSESWKLCLMFRLGARIVPCIDVLLGIALIVCLLMIRMPPCLGTCTGCVAVLHIETARETHVHVGVSFDGVGVHRGRVSCGHADSRCSWDKSWHDARTHSSLARRIVGEWGAWSLASTWTDDRCTSASPTSGPSASLHVATWLKDSNCRNVEMRKRGIVCRGQVTRCVCVRVSCHLLHHCLLVGVQLVDSCSYQRCCRCCRRCGELTLRGECSHLRYHHCRIGIFVIIQFFENCKRILHVSVLTRCVSCRVESALIRFLDERLQVDPDFICCHLVVPFFKIVLVQSTSKEQSDGVVQELHWGVRVAPECHYFLTILDPTEKNIGCIDGRVRAAK